MDYGLSKIEEKNIKGGLKMTRRPQSEVLELLKRNRIVKSREFVRSCHTWDHRKIISRLIASGKPIKNIVPGNKEAIYVWMGKD